MMNKMIKTTCALAVLAASCNVMAESVEMRVTGAVTPIACKPVLANNGIVDFGMVNANVLSDDALTWLPQKEVVLNITCSAPAKIALLATNGRPGTTLSDIDEGVTGASMPMVRGSIPTWGGVIGLGKDNEKKIGAFTLVVSDADIDGEKGQRIASADRIGWTNSNAKNSFFDEKGAIRHISWGKDDIKEPAAFKNLTTTIILHSYVNKKSELDLTKPIKIDGQANFEMFYL